MTIKKPGIQAGFFVLASFTAFKEAVKGLRLSALRLQVRARVCI